MTLHRRGVTEDLEALESMQSRALSEPHSRTGKPLYNRSAPCRKLRTLHICLGQHSLLDFKNSEA